MGVSGQGLFFCSKMLHHQKGRSHVSAVKDPASKIPGRVAGSFITAKDSPAELTNAYIPVVLVFQVSDDGSGKSSDGFGSAYVLPSKFFFAKICQIVFSPNPHFRYKASGLLSLFTRPDTVTKLTFSFILQRSSSTR